MNQFENIGGFTPQETLNILIRNIQKEKERIKGKLREGYIGQAIASGKFISDNELSAIKSSDLIPYIDYIISKLVEEQNEKLKKLKDDFQVIYGETALGLALDDERKGKGL